MTRLAAGTRGRLLVLLAVVVVAGCDSDAGFYIPGDTDPAGEADVLGASADDVAPGMDEDLEPAADLEPWNEDVVADMDVTEETGVDAGGEIASDAVEELPPVEDVSATPDLVEPMTCAATQQDAKGPYFIEGAPFNDAIAGPDEPGEPLLIKGFVLTEDCAPIHEVVIDVWQTDAEGLYPGEDEGFRLRGKVLPGDDGRYAFTTVLPGFYEGRPRHVHLKVSSPGYVDLVTQIYFEGDPYLWPMDSCGPPTCHSDDPARILNLTALGDGNDLILVGDIDLVLAEAE
jgi:catechol 1,2-dioxygenase